MGNDISLSVSQRLGLKSLKNLSRLLITVALQTALKDQRMK